MRIYTKLLILALSIQTHHTYSELGCMDNKDRKSATNYHYVACNCPCKRYTQIADRSKCTKCGHCHDNSPFIIISSAHIERNNKTQK